MRNLRPDDWPEVARIFEEGIATGNATGYASAVFYYPESRISVVVLANSTGFPVVPMASTLAGFVSSR